MELTVNTIIKRLPVIECVGNLQRPVHRIVSSSSETTAEDLVWVSDKNISQVGAINRGSVICSPKVDRAMLKSSCTYLLVDSPRLYFLNVVKSFLVMKNPPTFRNVQTFIRLLYWGKTLLSERG